MLCARCAVQDVYLLRSASPCYTCYSCTYIDSNMYCGVLWSQAAGAWQSARFFRGYVVRAGLLWHEVQGIMTAVVAVLP